MAGLEARVLGVGDRGGYGDVPQPRGSSAGDALMNKYLQQALH